MNPQGDVFERHSDFSVNEQDVGGVLSHRVEDNFLGPDVVISFVGKRRRIAVVRLIRGVAMDGFRSSG